MESPSAQLKITATVRAPGAGECPKNQQRLRDCMGPHDFHFKDGVMVCSHCGGQVAPAHAFWYINGLRHRAETKA